MSHPPALGRRPPHVTAEADFAAWFADLAAGLLNGVDLLVAGDPYRTAEVEMYYFDATAHPDPFTHLDPVQLESGRWYFHRTGGAYRGGSFKGVDLTFGDGRATFGVLVRTVVAPDGTLIDGPSLTVDHILARTNSGGVADLDARTRGRSIWDESSPLAVRPADPVRAAEVIPTARIGLTLKRGAAADAVRFVMRPYRYLTEPRRIGKGRPQLVVALHERGLDAATIRAATGVPAGTIARYLAAYAAGRAVRDFTSYAGRALAPADRCRLLGTWAARAGAVGP